MEDDQRVINIMRKAILLYIFMCLQIIVILLSSYFCMAGSPSWPFGDGVAHREMQMFSIIEGGLLFAIIFWAQLVALKGFKVNVSKLIYCTPILNWLIIQSYHFIQIDFIGLNFFESLAFVSPFVAFFALYFTIRLYTSLRNRTSS